MIGIFDSGVGGLSVLKEIRKTLPEQSLIYYCDNANCPYGEKSKEFIIQRAREISRFLIEQGAEIIVIACNTATAAAISTLRAEMPEIKFIGMEPAIKPAAKVTRTGVVGVLATAGTLKAEKYKNIKDQYGKDVKIVENIGKGFVEIVENGQTESPEAEEIVKASLLPLLEADADTIVLGCTHYPFLEKAIRTTAQNHLGCKDINIINPSPAVARQVAKVMKEEGIELIDSNGNQIILHSSGDPAIANLILSQL